MAALSFVMAVFFVPDIEKINSVETSESEKKEPPTSLLSVLYAMNPIRVFTFFVYPNIFFAVRTYFALSHNGDQNLAVNRNTTRISPVDYSPSSNIPCSLLYGASSVLDLISQRL